MTLIDLYGTLQAQQTLEAELLLSASTGATDNYEQLKNRPSINGVVLSGDKLSEDLYLASDEDLKTEATARENADNELLQKIGNTALTAQAQGASFTLTDASNNCGLYSLIVEGNSSQNGIPTPDAPIAIDSIGDSGSLTISATGKNLFNPESMSYTNHYSVRNDSFVVFVNPSAYNEYPITTVELPYGRYKIVVEVENVTGNAAVYVGNWNTAITTTRTISIEGNSIMICFAGKDGATITARVGIYSENSSTDFESYKGNTATITSALPLCSVGDVKDELIFNADGTAKIIKRTAIIDSYNGETIATEYISTSGELTTGATVVYPLATPEEINLTADETAAMLALETFEGLTNIFNSDNAQMSVKYWRNEALGSLLTSISRNTNSRLTALENAIIGG